MLQKVQWPIKNAELRDEIMKSKDLGELTPKALSMLLLMIDKIQMKFKYDNPEDQEDCKSAAIETILKKWDRYSTKYENCFSFFTQVIKNALYGGWNELHGKKADFSLSNIFTESA